ncbi:hypothetical protein SAMN05444161_9203 [Rhizobiales bacterium GAS191]|nr:hypothetical protein SAMN05444161_9203 [Rhizobiales bacterium GAS191]
MSDSGEPAKGKPAELTLVELLAEARRSETATINAGAIVRAFSLHDGGPHRNGRYFMENRGKALSAPRTNRNEERLAKELKGQQTLALPDGDELRLLDYQVPLKAVRSDKIGKIDLVGLTQDKQLALVELKIGESDENPRIALLELLTYWAVVRGNLASINGELAARQTPPHVGPVRLLILAPLGTGGESLRESNAG